MKPSPATYSSHGRPCILVVNFHSTCNAGDLALLKMNIRQMRKEFENASFLVSANHPKEPGLSQLEGCQIVPSAYAIIGAGQGIPVYQQIFRLLIGIIQTIFFRFFDRGMAASVGDPGWKGLIGAIRQADLVIGVSGNYFLSMGRYGWPFPITCFSVWAALLFKKPFYAMPQSIGPFRRGWEKFVIRRLYGRARRVYLRDQISLDMAKELGFPTSRTHFSPDPAFALPAASSADAQQILMKYGYTPDQPAVGVTAIAPLTRAITMDAINRYYQALATVLRRLTEQHGVRIYFFNQVVGPTPREDDRTAVNKLKELLPKDQNQFAFVDEVLSPEQLKACYGCMDLMIASRLHSGIFAMGAGVATLPIGYFTKSRGLMQSMGLAEWLVELEKSDAEEMWRKVNAAWIQREKLAASVQDKSRQFSDEVMNLGAEIRRDYASTQSRLKVAQLIKGLDVGDFSGGADVFGVNLACALCDAGLDARLIVFYQMNTPAENLILKQLAQHNVPVVFLQPWQGRTSFRSYWNGFNRLAEYIKAEQINLLHSHFHVGSVMTAWLRLVRIVAHSARTIHVDREWLRGWEGPIQQILIRFFIFILFPILIDIECGVSKEAVRVLNARWLARLFGKQACVIYNSVPSPDPARFEQALQRIAGQRTNGHFVIGTVGRMTEQKGHVYLLEAIPAVLKEVPNARFLWVGDGPLRAMLEEKAEQLGVRQMIEFTGTRHDVPALLDTMDLFVLPSVYEGLPTVVLESIAHGVPVIGTQIAGTSEIIVHNQTGWLAQPRSPQDLAKWIIYAAQKPQQRLRIARAALDALQEFTIERAAEKYLAVYNAHLNNVK